MKDQAINVENQFYDSVLKGNNEYYKIKKW